MKNLFLVGAGGHARSCIDVIEKIRNLKISGIIDKNYISILIIFSALNFDQECPFVRLLSNPLIDILKYELSGALHTDVRHNSQIDNLSVMETSEQFNFGVIFIN